MKQCLRVFVNSLIENPAFDSQTKETLTLKKSEFGSKCDLSEKFLKKVCSSPIYEYVLQTLKAKETVSLHKTMKAGKKKQKLFGIQKLEDANDAGGPKS